MTKRAPRKHAARAAEEAFTLPAPSWDRDEGTADAFAGRSDARQSEAFTPDETGESVAANHLTALVERIERLEEDRREIAGDIKARSGSQPPSPRAIATSGPPLSPRVFDSGSASRLGTRWTGTPVRSGSCRRATALTLFRLPARSPRSSRAVATIIRSSSSPTSRGGPAALACSA
jgi:hypothetical protein